MQPTTNQTVSATSSPQNLAADRRCSAAGQAPVLLDAELLFQISGGVSTGISIGSSASTANPNGSW